MALFSKKSKEVPRRRRAAEIQANEARQEVAERSWLSQNTTFRRNRTLTGSLSSQVTSANELQSDLKSPRTHAHDLAKQRRKVSGVLGIVVACGVFLAALLYEFTAVPAVTATDGSVALQKARYQDAVDEYLGRHPIERLRFLLDRQRLNDYIQHKLPEVSSITPEGMAGFGASNFSVAVRKPLVGWLIGSTQYYVDDSGVPFQINYYETPRVRIVDQSGVQQASGTAIASSRFLNFVGRSVSVANDYNLNVEQAIIPAGTTRQIALKVQSHAYPVKLSLDRPVGEQIEDMQRAIAYLDSKKLTPQYVDVRVSGKAFYK